MNNFGFAAASKEEALVFGASRPGYPRKLVEPTPVKQWLSLMNQQEIKRIVCLLPEAQLGYYTALPHGLLGSYREALGEEKVLHVPIIDYHLCSPERLKGVLQYLKDAEAAGERVVVHCSGGIGRTGHVLAAWLVFARGLQPSDAIKAVARAGRNALEAVEAGNAKKEDLIALLQGCIRRGTAKGIQGK